MHIVLEWIIKYFGMAAKESGERRAYELTSDNFAHGLWRVSGLNNIVPDNKVLVEYRESGWGENIWEFTLAVREKALAKGVAL